jgi:hypothetical protein
MKYQNTKIQNAYVNEIEKAGNSAYSIVKPEAFCKSIRDLGYRSVAKALFEHVDNALQAEADLVHIVSEVKAPAKSKSHIRNLAIIDDGHGMLPSMIRAAVTWGGGTRQENRDGYGRFAFGLQSSAVSLTEQFSVYSKVEDGEWHVVTIDLKAIVEGKWTNDQGLVVVPEAQKTNLPTFVTSYLEKESLSLESGTVVVLENPDRLRNGYASYGSFTSKMLYEIGITYLDVVDSKNLVVNGERAEKIDPTFLDPKGRGYDVGNGIMAEDHGTAVIKLKTKDGEELPGEVRIKYSYLPRMFNRTDTKLNDRNDIMKDNNAFFLVYRHGRLIDRVTRARFPNEGFRKTLGNNDRHWVALLDFDPVLDEYFGITVNKQQSTLNDDLWKALEEAGVHISLQSLWKKITAEQKEKPEVEPESEEPTTSEQVLIDADVILKKKDTEARKTERKQNLEREVERKAKSENRDPDEVRPEIYAETDRHKYKITYESVEGAPFFRMEVVGPQTRVIINQKHPFYTDLYAGPQSTPQLKNALDLMLYAIGSCELETTGTKELFYQTERFQWSQRLNILLSMLDEKNQAADIRDAEASEEELLKKAS